VGRLAQARDPSRSPLFDVLFNYLTHTGHRGDSLDVIALPQVEGQFDITLTATEDGDHLGLVLGYSKDLFVRDTAARLLVDLVRLLECGADDPHQIVMVPDERAKIALDHDQASGTAAPPPSTPSRDPGSAGGSSDAPKAEPAAAPTAVEARLAAIWRELLGV